MGAKRTEALVEQPKERKTKKLNYGVIGEELGQNTLGTLGIQQQRPVGRGEHYPGSWELGEQMTQHHPRKPILVVDDVAKFHSPGFKDRGTGATPNFPPEQLFQKPAIPTYLNPWSTP